MDTRHDTEHDSDPRPLLAGLGIALWGCAILGLAIWFALHIF